MGIGELKEKHNKMKHSIASRLDEFDNVGKQGGERLFEELAFCILTPQSKAFSCDRAVSELKTKGLLFGGTAKDIRFVLVGKTRFHNKKAEYLAMARKRFAKDCFADLCSITLSGNEKDARKRIIKEVRGLGWKEASHYLRNVGRGKTLAILDRHILKNLVRHGAIGEVPKSLTMKKYLEIEERMMEFCRKTRIPPAHLDLLFWAEETGQIFK